MIWKERERHEGREGKGEAAAEAGDGVWGPLCSAPIEIPILWFVLHLKRNGQKFKNFVSENME